MDGMEGHILMFLYIINFLILYVKMYSSTIFTEDYGTYNQIEENDFTRKSVIHARKEYANGVIHFNSCEYKSSL